MKSDLGAIGDRPGYFANRAYEEALVTNSKFVLRRAAETAYLGLIAAADAAACRLPPARLVNAPIRDRQPKRVGERGQALRRLEQHLKLPRKSITAGWTKLGERLHGDCFYNARCRKRDVVQNIKLAREQTRYIMGLLRVVPRASCPI